jgi:hypothetical protein
MEHAAKSLNKDPLDIRMLNMFTDTQVFIISILHECEVKMEKSVTEGELFWRERGSVYLCTCIPSKFLFQCAKTLMLTFLIL